MNDNTLVGKYETAFCVLMAAAAYLCRDNPHLVYPQVLVLLLVILGLNLAAGVVLRRWPTRQWASALIILANCGAVTAILSYSGGAESNLWVLYLLPVYSVCLLLGSGEVLLITAGTVGFNTAFGIFAAGRWSEADLFGLALKNGILVFAAAVTWRVVSGDRQARRSLEAKRGEMKFLERALDSQRLRLDQAQRLADMGLMSSGITHDLNNVFSVILGYAEVMTDYRALPPEFAQDLDRIRQSALLGRNIVAGFMGHFRSSEPALAECDLHESICSVLGLLQEDFRREGVKVELMLAGHSPRVKADPVNLQRLFLNLATNAARAMRGGGVLRVSTELVSAGGREASGVRAVVEDSGPGIGDEIMKNLFKPFATARRGEGGTGLGLFLCSAIARESGGSLCAENRPEGGARFTLYLPIPGRDSLNTLPSPSRLETVMVPP